MMTIMTVIQQFLTLVVYELDPRSSELATTEPMFFFFKVHPRYISLNRI